MSARATCRLLELRSGAHWTLGSGTQDQRESAHLLRVSFCGHPEIVRRVITGRLRNGLRGLKSTHLEQRLGDATQCSAGSSPRVNNGGPRNSRRLSSNNYRLAVGVIRRLAWR